MITRLYRGDPITLADDPHMEGATVTRCPGGEEDHEFPEETTFWARCQEHGYTLTWSPLSDVRRAAAAESEIAEE
ncbi:hypothetical protein ACFYVL_43725 [Streptomyces sp. NPDC004111]|uniref:hypothetical protein n=1 Tax=Streptomyces sp. NPDC004111 TaxID=3364690 RepID=UPI003694FE8A